MSGDKRTWSAEKFFHRLVTHGRDKQEDTEEEDTTSRPAKNTLDLADIQGFILRGYRMPMVRHFVLTVGVPAKARELLGRLVSGDESDAPQITTAEDWHVGFVSWTRRQPRRYPTLQARLLP